MKKLTLVMAVAPILSLVSSGCAVLETPVPKSKPSVVKHFFGGSITYSVDAEAQPILKKLVQLHGMTLSEQSGDSEASSDLLTLPLYRDTDVDRDHHITLREADAFYVGYVRQFEDHLGEVVYQ